MNADIDKAVSALQHLNPSMAREDWYRACAAARAAEIPYDTFNEWSAGGDSYNPSDCRSTWNSLPPHAGGIGAATLFGMAKREGWKSSSKPSKIVPAKAAKPPAPAPELPQPSPEAQAIWSRASPLTLEHPYCRAKKLTDPAAVAGLRVLADTDGLVLDNIVMAGAAVVPLYRPGTGELQSVQCIATDGQKRTKGKMADACFVVGAIEPGQPAYVVEGIGAAWAVWQATGSPAIVTCGVSRTETVAAAVKANNPDAKIVLAPDAGQEMSAEKVAQHLDCAVVVLPGDWPKNSDAWDFLQVHGHGALAGVLESAAVHSVNETAPAPTAPSAPRYKLLSSGDLRALPPLAWRVRGVLPAVGLAALFGPSASGKSFLAFDMAAAIAEGSPWFDCRVTQAPVVYCALEGEAGFKLRAQAWEMSRGRSLPDGLLMMMQSFKLTELQDVIDLAAVVPAGAVVVLDTLNRAAPTADENSSRDMGEILEAAKTLQAATGGLVVLVHHTGKNAAAGLRGHSSLFAAMDAAIEVCRDGDRREWKVAKSKDGMDGEARQFKLAVEVLGFEPTGETVTSCVVVRDTALEDVRAVKVPQGGNQRLVWDALRPLFKTGTTGKPGAPPASACIELEPAIVIASGHLTCSTDKRTSRTRDAITGLVARGLLGCNDGWIWLK